MAASSSYKDLMVPSSARSSLIRLAAGTAVAVLGLTACTGGGPGSEEELVDALTRDEAFTQEEAECLANAVFNEYGDDEEALGRISGAGDYETLVGEGEDSVEGFGQFFDNAIAGCTGS